MQSDFHDSYFLPHQLRTVFNGSIKLPLANISLKDLLHVGPNLLPNLSDQLCSWRQYKYVFEADDEKMYQQVSVHEDDHKFQSILWRFDSSEPIDVYRIPVLVYGIKRSGYLADRSVKQTAIKHPPQFPLGAEIINKEMYLDNVTSEGHSIEEVRAKQTEVNEILKMGGFNLRKWLANSDALLSDWPRE